MKTDTKERTRKMLATQADNKARWERQRITINKKFSIARIDDENWQIQKEGKPFPRQNYHGTIYGAFRALSGEMIGDYDKASVADLLKANRRIVDEIERALEVSRDITRPLHQ